MQQTVAYYVEKGFSQKMAEYFASGRKKIVEVAPNDDFSLTLRFDNGEVRSFNVFPLLQEGTVFAPLRDLSNFRRVYLDENRCVSWDVDPAVDSNVVWSNKIDLCSDNCYVDSTPIQVNANDR